MADDRKVPPGMVPVFPGWNVWTVWQVDDLGDLNPANFGLSKERRLRIWVEAAAQAAPGAAVADPVNPLALKGAQVELIPTTEGLELAAGRDPSLMLSAAAHPFNVRFFNRGAFGVTPWPHDDEYLLDDVWRPSTSNPITNGPRPDSLGGGATDAANAVKNAAGDIAGVVVVAVAGVGLILLLSRVRKGR
jgi:hypothetical protein